MELDGVLMEVGMPPSAFVFGISSFMLNLPEIYLNG